MPALISSADACEQLDCHRSTLTRAAKKLGVGVMVGTSFGFTASEVTRIGKIIRDSPGCPKFKPGNDLWKRRKNNKKSRR